MCSGWSLLMLVYACKCGLEKMRISEDVYKGREQKHRHEQEVEKDGTWG